MLPHPVYVWVKEYKLLIALKSVRAKSYITILIVLASKSVSFPDTIRAYQYNVIQTLLIHPSWVTWAS